jgi:hypothetical protein
MVANIVAGIAASCVLGIGALLWRHRVLVSVAGLGLLASGTIRVSMAALLRVKDDDRYVLFHSSYRPGSYGPPGGVFKALPSAKRFLDRIGFREHRSRSRARAMHADLRGFVRASEVATFLRWFAKNLDRESGPDCLRRELVEELNEGGHGTLAPLVAGATFTHVRTVLERPTRVPGETYRQVRRFEIYDLALADVRSQRLRAVLLALAADSSAPGIISATSGDIIDGRRGRNLLAPQSAFLFGWRRYRQDLPPTKG